MNEQSNNFFTFMLGDTFYAIPVTSVKEVLPYEKVTPVPRTADYMKGVMNIRGTVISVIDFRVLFGLPIEEVGKSTSVIVCEVSNSTDTPLSFGFIADSVNGVGDLTKEPTGSGTNTEFVKNLCRLDNHLVLVLDLEKIIYYIENQLNNSKIK